MLVNNMTMLGGSVHTIPISPAGVTSRSGSIMSGILKNNPSSSQLDLAEKFFAEQDLAVSNKNFVKYIIALQNKANKESAQAAQAQNIKRKVCKYV